MKQLKFGITITLLGIFSFSCNIKAPEKEIISDGFESVEFISEDPIVEIYYQIPSPDEMFAFIQEEGLTFKPEILHPADYYPNYHTSKAQALNFGVFSADLAYAAAFEEYQVSGVYFQSIQKLAENLGIESVFDQQMVERIKNNMNNIDSLEKISSESYFNVIDYLLEVENGKTLTLITIGGWVESLYIFSNLVETFTPTHAAIQRIADQKLTMQNLMKIVRNLDRKNEFSEITKELDLINAFFDKLEVISAKIAKEQIKEASKNVISGDKIKISSKEFDDLKQIVFRLRTDIVTGLYN